MLSRWMTTGVERENFEGKGRLMEVEEAGSVIT
jgi:hypothetical protein